MRKQHQKNYPSRFRSSGCQTTLQSFLFKPRVVDGELKPSPPPLEDEEEPISPPAPPKREIIRVTNKTVKEKATAFSSVGSSSGKSGGGEASGASALNAAVFKRFNSSASVARAEAAAAGVTEAEGDADDGGCVVRLDVEEIAAGSPRRESLKRKSPLGDDDHKSSAKHVVVLGDDPKPKPPPPARRRRQANPTGRGGEGDQALYNHYASGSGWWHGDMEGVDGEAVGWTDNMWEGMGSITLGGLEWH